MSCHSFANFSFLTMSHNAWKKGAALTVRLLKWRLNRVLRSLGRAIIGPRRRRAAGVGEGPRGARQRARRAAVARGGACGYAARGRQCAGAGHDGDAGRPAHPVPAPTRLCLSHLWLWQGREAPAHLWLWSESSQTGVRPARRCAGMWPCRAGPGRAARRRRGERYGTLEPLTSNRHRNAVVAASGSSGHVLGHCSPTPGRSGRVLAGAGPPASPPPPSPPVDQGRREGLGGREAVSSVC